MSLQLHETALHMRLFGYKMKRHQIQFMLAVLLAQYVTVNSHIHVPVYWSH